MAQEFEQEADIDRVLQWLNDNWLSLVVAVVVGLGAVFGWFSWQKHSNQKALSAADNYQMVLQRFDDNGLTEDTLGAVADYQSHFKKSPYAADLSLQIAAVAVDENQPDTALELFDWVLEHSKDKGITSLAQVRKARVLWSQDQADQALELLAQKHPASFDRLYAELTGDILAEQGETQQAFEAYRTAWLATQSDANAARLRSKLMQAAPKDASQDELLVAE